MSRKCNIKKIYIYSVSIVSPKILYYVLIFMVWTVDVIVYLYMRTVKLKINFLWSLLLWKTTSICEPIENQNNDYINVRIKIKLYIGLLTNKKSTTKSPYI